MSIIQAIKDLINKKSQKDEVFQVEKVVFDVEWDREVLIMKNIITDQSCVLSLDLHQEYENSINAKQELFEQFSPLMDRLKIKVRHLTLYKNKANITAARCQFLVGKKWVPVDLSLQECISLSIHQEQPVRISPRILQVQRHYKQGYSEESCDLFREHTASAGISYFENEVIM